MGSVPQRVCAALALRRQLLSIEPLAFFTFIVFGLDAYGVCQHQLSKAETWARRVVRCCTFDMAVSSVSSTHVNVAQLLEGRRPSSGTDDAAPTADVLFAHADLWLDFAKPLPLMSVREALWTPHLAEVPHGNLSRQLNLSRLLSLPISRHVEPGSCYYTRNALLRRIGSDSNFLPACTAALEQLPMAARFLAQRVTAGLAEAPCCYGWADLLYLPAASHGDFVQLAHVLRATYHELSVPLIAFVISQVRGRGIQWLSMPCHGHNVAHLTLQQARASGCAHAIDLREVEHNLQEIQLELGARAPKQSAVR